MWTKLLEWVAVKIFIPELRKLISEIWSKFVLDAAEKKRIKERAAAQEEARKEYEEALKNTTPENVEERAKAYEKYINAGRS